MENQPLGQLIPLSAIYPSNTNPRKRFNEVDLKELAESIKQHGVMQPILVRPTNVEAVNNGTEHYFIYEIVAGERRYRASKLAGIEYIPAIARDLNDLETLQLQIIENLQRSDLHPLEEAQGFKALLDNKDAKSWNADQLAEKIGKSRSYIYASLKLCELSTYAQDLFLDDKFGREVALLIARIPGKKLQEPKEIVKGNGMDTFSYRAAKSYVHARYTLDLNNAPFDTHISAEGSCLSCPKRSGNYPELFPDIESPDVCTDPDCFGQKKAAHVQFLISQAPKVLTGAEAEKIMPYGAQSWISGRDYAKPEESASGNNGKSWSDLLGDDMPAPVLLVDDKNNTINLYETTALQQKLEEKIASGELVISESEVKQKSAQQLENEAHAKNRKNEVLRRSNAVEEIHHKLSLNKLSPEQLSTTLTHAIQYIKQKVMSTHEEIVPKLYQSSKNFNEFIEFMANEDVNDKLNLLVILICAAQIEPVWDFGRKECTGDDKLSRLRDIAASFDINLDQEALELPFTPLPAAQAQELTAEVDAPVKPNFVFVSGSVDALSTTDDNRRFFVVDGPKETAAHSEEKPLPPKLQAIKDKELAKRANKAKKQEQKESATADANQ